MNHARSFRRAWPAALAVVVTALTLGACGGSSSAPPQTTGDVEHELGFDDSALIVRQSRMEAVVRDCMKAQGFDYVPVDPAAQRAALFGSSRLSDIDFIKQFGYGVSTLWGHGSPQVDPNQRLRASLGAADRAAYDRALGGDDPSATFADAMDTGDFSKLGGCRLKAARAIFGGTQVLTEIQGKLDQLDERILQDQRMVRAVERWASCMTAAGLHYDDPDVIEGDLLKRMQRIVGPVSGKYATGPPAGQRPPAYDHVALAALQHEEVATATADYACERKNITAVEAVVRPQLEARFRRQNRSLLTRVKPVR
jgi:hypothetical protein